MNNSWVRTPADDIKPGDYVAAYPIKLSKQIFLIGRVVSNQPKALRVNVTRGSHGLGGFLISVNKSHNGILRKFEVLRGPNHERC